MSAGNLRELISFEKRIDAPDGYGNTVASWDEGHRCRAGVTWLRGGESVIAARLQGTRVAALMIRKCAAADLITPEWRAVDVRTGETFNIRSINPSKGRGYIDLLCESGVAHG